MLTETDVEMGVSTGAVEYTRKSAVARSTGGLEEERLPMAVMVYTPVGTLATVKLPVKVPATGNEHVGETGRAGWMRIGDPDN